MNMLHQSLLINTVISSRDTLKCIFTYCTCKQFFRIYSFKFTISFYCNLLQVLFIKMYAEYTSDYCYRNIANMMVVIFSGNLDP